MPVSMTVSLGGDIHVVVCEETLRVLGARRLVVRGRCAKGQVVVKAFFGSRAPRYRRREEAGIRALMRCGVAVPELLGSGVLAEGGEYVVNTFVAGVVPDRSDIDALTRILARLHEGGVLHTDPHIANFIKTDGVLYAVDGDAVRVCRVHRGPRHRVSERKSLGNLARLCAELDVIDVASPLASYCDQRGWRATASKEAALAALTADARERRVAKFVRKTLRECSEFSFSQTAGQVSICARAACCGELDRLLADLDGHVESGESLKRGNTATVSRVRLGAKKVYVVKRYNVKSLLHRLRIGLRTSRARRSWMNGNRLMFQDIPTARPVAMIERRSGIAFYVMENLEGLDLVEFIESHGLDETTLNGVVRIFASLRAAGLQHGDTKATNFIVTADGVFVVDLDALGPAKGSASHDRDVRRFLENWREPDVRSKFQHALMERKIDGFEKNQP